MIKWSWHWLHLGFHLDKRRRWLRAYRTTLEWIFGRQKTRNDAFTHTSMSFMAFPYLSSPCVFAPCLLVISTWWYFIFELLLKSFFCYCNPGMDWMLLILSCLPSPGLVFFRIILYSLYLIIYIWCECSKWKISEAFWWYYWSISVQV